MEIEVELLSRCFSSFFSQESSGRSLPAVTRRQKEPALGTASVSINSLQHLLAFCDVCNLGFLLIGPGDAATLRGDRLGPRVAGIHSRCCHGDRVAMPTAMCQAQTLRWSRLRLIFLKR